MRRMLGALGLAILTATICAPTTASAQADLPREALSKLSDLQTMAGQWAEQAGQFSGRSVGPQLASASSQLVQVLTNFDRWACGAAVLALHLKRQRLAVAAANAMPADPALDKAVVDFGNLIAQLQELCDRYVFSSGQPGAVAVNTTGGTTAQEPEPPPPPPAQTVQERICHNRCDQLYTQYLDANREYERVRGDAVDLRQIATRRTQEAEAAAQRAQTTRQNAENEQRAYDQAQAALSASRDQAERLKLAEQISHLSPAGARSLADNAQQASDQAARAAQQSGDLATRTEVRASALYDAMLEIYEAWLRCARECAQQVQTYDHVTLDLGTLFPMAPTRTPPRPPFYRAAPAPATRTASVVPAEARQASTHAVTTPMALSGGTLVGAVYDSDGQKREDERVALTTPDGRRTELRTGAGGRFSLAVPRRTGTLAVALPGTAGDPVRINVVNSIPADMATRLPDFLELGSTMNVAMPLRDIRVSTAAHLELELPSAVAIAADRTTGITSFVAPAGLGTGRVTIHATGIDGQDLVSDAVAYGYLNAWIDNDKLHSGENAQFGYDLDFGTGPMTVSAVVTVQGPIVYERAGQPQVVEVDAEGHARLTGYVHALKGSPAGIPFSIVATFQNR